MLKIVQLNNNYGFISAFNGIIVGLIQADTSDWIFKSLFCLVVI